MEKSNIDEEVVITPIIRDIERLVIRFFNWIKSIIVTIIDGIKQLLEIIFSHFLLVGGLTIIGAAIGYFSLKIIPRQYESSMVVKLNINSQDQLNSDIDYFNALIAQNEHTSLAEIFRITSETVTQLKQFSLSPHTGIIDKTKSLDLIYKTTDSTVYNLLQSKDLLTIENTELSRHYKIAIRSTNYKIFSQLENSIITYINQSPELNLLLETQRKSLERRKNILVQQIKDVDTLKSVMNLALITKSSIPGNNNSDTYINLSENNKRNAITALDLQDRAIFYTKEIALIEQKLTESDSPYFIQTHLFPVGKKIGVGGLLRTIGFASAFFILAMTIIWWRKNRTANK